MSFKRAADELGVTPTAISHQIRLLEDLCRQPLFRRRPRPLALTSSGERLFPVLRHSFDACVAAIASISTKTERRALRVTSPNAFASRWLIPRLPQWRAEHPEISLEIIGTDKVLDLRLEEADLAIRYARKMPIDLVAHEIFRDTFFPVCSHDLLAREVRQITRAADVLRYPMIHFDWMNRDPEAPTWTRWLAMARSVAPDFPEFDRRWDLSFREELHAIDAVVAGEGIAICSDVVLSRELKNGTLVKAHDLSLPGYGFYLVYMPHHTQEATLKTFLAWIRSAD